MNPTALFALRVLVSALVLIGCCLVIEHTELTAETRWADVACTSLVVLCLVTVPIATLTLIWSCC